MEKIERAMLQLNHQYNKKTIGFKEYREKFDNLLSNYKKLLNTNDCTDLDLLEDIQEEISVYTENLLAQQLENYTKERGE